MHARRVRNVAEHLARGAFDHHHVGGARHEHAARGGFDGDVVRAAVALDIELFNLERLRVPDAGAARLAAKRTASAVSKRLVIRASMVVAKRVRKAGRRSASEFLGGCLP